MTVILVLFEVCVVNSYFRITTSICSAVRNDLFESNTRPTASSAISVNLGDEGGSGGTGSTVV